MAVISFPTQKSRMPIGRKCHRRALLDHRPNSAGAHQFVSLLAPIAAAVTREDPRRAQNVVIVRTSQLGRIAIAGKRH
jgi:hypothetical protein